MKLRQSHMPEETQWETFFDVPLILDRLGIGPELRDVAELGCGYATFTLPVAQRISGVFHTFDIDPVMVERTRERAKQNGVHNVVCTCRDVFQESYGLAPGSVDACLLFNILHAEEPVRLLTLSAEIVRSGGWIHVIHWRYDAATPRGPSMDIRPRPEQIREWAEKTGTLQVVGGLIDLLPWHYGWQFRKTETADERR